MFLIHEPAIYTCIHTCYVGCRAKVKDACAHQTSQTANLLWRVVPLLQDKGVCAEAESQGLTGELDNWEKIDELPFDFERRRLSVVLQRREGNKEERRPLLICKV